MLLILPIVIALAAGPTPSPEPSSAARPTPLTEIGRVRAIPACVPIVAHANGAITEALENDRTLAIISANIRSTDFDGLNFIKRRNAIEAMLRHAEAIAKASKTGEDEVKRLREYALNSPDPKRKAELKTFADALGGAMYRQKKAAIEIQRDVAIIRGREAAEENRERMDDVGPVQRPGLLQGMTTPRPLHSMAPPDPLYDKHFKGLAEKLDELNQGILRDEGVAADHSIAATSGC